MLAPARKQVLPVLLVIVARVGKERGAEDNVAQDGRHLRLERLARRLPALLLLAERLEQRHRPVHLALDRREVGLDRLGFGDEQGVLFFVNGDRPFQMSDGVLHVFSLLLVLLCLLFVALELVPERLNAFEHLRVVDLSNGPLDHGTAGLRSTVHLLEVVIRVREVLLKHDLPDLVRDVVGREVDDVVDEVLAHDYPADSLPVCLRLAEEQADRLQSKLDDRGRVGHGPNLDQVLLLDRLDGSLGVLDRRFDFGQIGHDFLLLDPDRVQLLGQVFLDLLASLLLSLGFLLVVHHLLQLLVRRVVLRLQLLREGKKTCYEIVFRSIAFVLNARIKKDQTKLSLIKCSETNQ